MSEVTAAVSMCLNLTVTCRSAVDEDDPEGWENSAEENSTCLQACLDCFTNVILESLSGVLTLDTCFPPTKGVTEGLE